MSKGLRKTVIVVLLLAAAVYIGAKLYVRSEADTALREAAYALREVIRLDYESFSAGLDGSLTLHNLNVRPAEGRGELFMRSLTLTADSLPAALGIRSALAAGGLAGALAVSATDVRLSFDSPRYRRLNAWSGGLFIGTPLDHLGCGELQDIDAEALEDMGYPHFGANARLDFRRGRDERAALVSIEITAEDIARVRGEAVLRNPEATLSVADLRTGRVSVADVDLRYRDDGYFDSRNYFCAAQRDSDVAGFLDAHMKSVPGYLRSRGVVAGDPLLDAYRRLIASPGNELHLALAPEKPLVLRALEEMDADALTEALNPGLAINGDPVEDLALRWVEPDANVAGVERDDESSGPPRFHPADPGMLHRLVGSYARLITYKNTAYEGVISEAKDRRVKMQRQFKTGDMSFDLAVDNIKSAEIYRRQPLPAELQPKPEEEAGTPTVVTDEVAEPAPDALEEESPSERTEPSIPVTEDGQAPAPTGAVAEEEADTEPATDAESTDDGTDP
jgi:hypothetical protein